MTKVINIFGGPGVGKSRNAAALFVALKDKHIPCELVTEYAKQMTYENRSNILADQLYILAKQNRKLVPMRGVVDYVISDSPLPIGLMYMPEDYYKTFPALVHEVFGSYDNINVVIERNPEFPYQQYGRNQDEYQAKLKSAEIDELLRISGIPVFRVMAGANCVPAILKELKV